MTELHTTDTVVIGAGHAGLAVSRLLTRAGREHVVLDRGRVAERWRTERWDSLHLLTPRWMTRLPGWRYTGPEQEGFMPAGELVGHLERYAVDGATPLALGEEVRHVSMHRGGYRVDTAGRSWRAQHVVIATGPTGRPNVPATMERLDPDVHRMTPSQYRNPDELAPGGVLVVGASASGTQIADELVRAGRRVVLAVGRHTRMPRRYRGMDIFWWLEKTGRLGRTIDEMPDPDTARNEVSMQLVGRVGADPVESAVDLGALQRRGVRLAGRLHGLHGHTATFGDGLADLAADADRRMHALLDSVDRYVER